MPRDLPDCPCRQHVELHAASTVRRIASEACGRRTPELRHVPFERQRDVLAQHRRLIYEPELRSLDSFCTSSLHIVNRFRSASRSSAASRRGAGRRAGHVRLAVADRRRRRLGRAGRVHGGRWSAGRRGGRGLPAEAAVVAGAVAACPLAPVVVPRLARRSAVVVVAREVGGVVGLPTVAGQSWLEAPRRWFFDIQEANVNDCSGRPS